MQSSSSCSSGLAVERLSLAWVAFAAMLAFVPFGVGAVVVGTAVLVGRASGAAPPPGAISGAGGGLAGARADALVSGPREFTGVLSVSNAATTEIRYSSTYKHAIARCVNETPDVPVHIVEAAATDVTAGSAAYCDSCVGGAVLPPLGVAFLRSSVAGPASVRCTFNDGWPVGMSVPSSPSPSGVRAADACLLAGGADCAMEPAGVTFPSLGASVTTGIIPFTGAPSTYSGLKFEGGTDDAIGFGPEYVSLAGTQLEFLEEAGSATAGAIRFYLDDSEDTDLIGVHRAGEILWALYANAGSTYSLQLGPTDGSDDTAAVMFEATQANNQGTLHIGSYQLRNGAVTTPIACFSDDLGHSASAPNEKACMYANTTFAIGLDVGGTDLSMSQSGFNKASASTETVAFQNSGAGVMTVTVDGDIGVSPGGVPAGEIAMLYFAGSPTIGVGYDETGLLFLENTGGHVNVEASSQVRLIAATGAVVDSEGPVTVTGVNDVSITSEATDVNITASGDDVNVSAADDVNIGVVTGGGVAGSVIIAPDGNILLFAGSGGICADPLCNTGGGIIASRDADTENTHVHAAVADADGVSNDCDAANEEGRMAWDPVEDEFCVCSGAGGWLCEVMTTAVVDVASTRRTVAVEVASAAALALSLVSLARRRSAA